MNTSSIATRMRLVVLLAALFSVAGWFPAARGQDVPPTVARRLAVSLAAVTSREAGGLVLERNGALRSRAALRTRPLDLCAPIRFTAVGLAWTQLAGGDAEAIVRTGEATSELGRPAVLESEQAEGPDRTSPEFHPTRRATELVWNGEARCLRFSLELPARVVIEDLEAVFINTSGTAWSEYPGSSASGLRLPVFGAAAHAMTARPAIVARSGWGADESLRNCSPSYASKLQTAFVHHTVNSNSYSRARSDDVVRAIYWYHTRVNGWCDIAYNFLVDRYGQIFMGRAGGETRPVIPAAQQGFNTGSVAVAAIGDFTGAAPSSATLSAIKRLLAWRLDLGHVPANGSATVTSGGGERTRYPAGRRVTLPVVSTHRTTGYTACPGDYLSARIGEIRRGAAGIGRPKILRPSRSAPSVTPGGQPVRFTARATDSLLWTVSIIDSSDAVVRTLTDVGRVLQVEWDGTNELHLPVAPGSYRAVLRGTRPDGGAARPAVLRVVVRPAPLPRVQPRA